MLQVHQEYTKGRRVVFYCDIMKLHMTLAISKIIILDRLGCLKYPAYFLDISLFYISFALLNSLGEKSFSDYLKSYFGNFLHSDQLNSTLTEF